MNKSLIPTQHEYPNYVYEILNKYGNITVEHVFTSKYAFTVEDITKEKSTTTLGKVFNMFKPWHKKKWHITIRQKDGRKTLNVNLIKALYYVQANKEMKWDGRITRTTSVTDYYNASKLAMKVLLPDTPEVLKDLLDEKLSDKQIGDIYSVETLTAFNRRCELIKDYKGRFGV